MSVSILKTQDLLEPFIGYFFHDGKDSSYPKENYTGALFDSLQFTLGHKSGSSF